jgi:hypothetical protein
MPPTEPTTAPTMTEVFGPPPSVLKVGDCDGSVVLLRVSLVVWVGLEVPEVDLPALEDLAAEPGAAVIPLGSST